MERDAKYAAVAIFALVAVAAAFLFVWWYSGRGDRRDYENYEIYFNGSVSGLGRGSPVRYLGVDVGRVNSLSVDKRNPGRVKVIAQIDSTTPITTATQAQLGLLGLTGLLYIDLQSIAQPIASTAPLPHGEEYLVIASRKGDIEAFVELLPDTVAHAVGVLGRLEKLLDDENLKSVGDTLASLRRASSNMPEIAEQARAMASELRRTAEETEDIARRLQQVVGQSQPDLQSTISSARVAAEKLAHTADSLDHIVSGNEAALTQFAGTGVGELQQLIIDAREASAEVRSLASSLRANPSALIREPKETGVEIPK
ncbi:MAG TPA: MlaD family protein [Steroidobacteraceae bacterium]|nr:MlaD family protein [Steroidobacteraceae bacterium]